MLYTVSSLFLRALWERVIGQSPGGTFYIIFYLIFLFIFFLKNKIKLRM